MNEPKERPILFSGPMVRAILADRKTQTRRVVKYAIPAEADEVFYWSPAQVAGALNVTALAGLWARKNDPDPEGTDGWLRELGPCPYGQPGNRLWVRETWGDLADAPEHYGATCREQAATDAAMSRPHQPREGCRCAFRWRPSIHMPRWASRLTLEVVDVRVQRLQEISEEDAQAEGVVLSDDVPPGFLDHRGLDPDQAYRGAFASLWDGINGERAPWSENPWVWAITFRNLTPG